jgi:sugar/nucleoside kinase (ribokinase family)
LIFIDGFYPEIALPVCKKAKEKKLMIIFDGGSWKPAIKEILPLIDIAICSEQFFPPGCRHFSEVIQYLHQLGVSKIAITRGEKSIQWSENNWIKSIEIYKKDSIDSLGAGDIIHGAFLWYMLEKNNFETALVLASKVASFSTRYKGTREWMKYFKS